MSLVRVLRESRRSCNLLPLPFSGITGSFTIGYGLDLCLYYLAAAFLRLAHSDFALAQSVELLLEMLLEHRHILRGQAAAKAFKRVFETGLVLLWRKAHL